MKTISIITPSYNQGQFLEDCIHSVINQNYANLEYIIIDGGSTDNSLEIIKKYQTNLTYWVSEPDHGQAEAINKGLRHATGEIVAWLNSDDFYLPHALEHVAQAYQATPTAPFYFGNGLRVDQHGQPKRPHFPKTVIFNQEALLFGLNYILQPATFIRRESLEKVGYLDTNLHYGLDTDLWLRLSTLGEPATIESQLAVSREYSSTKTALGSFNRIEELRQIAENHSGKAITPGIICYFLDTLYQLTQEQPDLFPSSYRRDILRFWGDTSLQFEKFGAAPDGFPLSPHEKNSFLHRLKRIGWVRLRDFIKGYGFANICKPC